MIEKARQIAANGKQTTNVKPCRTCGGPFELDVWNAKDCRGCRGSDARNAAMLKRATEPSFFDGITYDPDLDHDRLKTLLGRVRELMSDGTWRTLADIRQACGGSEAGVSARLRDLRKERFGKHRVERRRKTEGLWEYRVEP